ncbi:unnamed protein product [Allacma fusca]|uniref:Uncharacterized protein n=1 Tax=Allacma fusca TaxID=39272 RepID=A0A8J2PL26_9HEXA|nr:unnamed protein product [Allacma fusca]
MMSWDLIASSNPGRDDKVQREENAGAITRGNANLERIERPGCINVCPFVYFGLNEFLCGERKWEERGKGDEDENGQ